MKSIFILALCSVGLSVVGCAHSSVERGLATKMSEEAPVSGTQELRSDVGALIENTKLTASQKSQLKALQLTSSKQSQSFRDESLKLRSILIKDVFSKNYNESEATLIQNKIEKVEHKRLALMFETIDKANGILGRETNAQENEQLMDRLMTYREM